MKDRHKLLEPGNTGGMIFFINMLILVMWSIVAICWYTIKGSVIEVGNANPNVFGSIFAGAAGFCLINIFIVAIDFVWRVNYDNAQLARGYLGGREWTAKSFYNCPQKGKHHIYEMFSVHLKSLICFAIASAILFVRSRAYNGAQDNEQNITELQQDSRYIQSMIGWTAGFLGAVLYLGSTPTFMGFFNDFHIGGRMDKHDAANFVSTYTSLRELNEKYPPPPPSDEESELLTASRNA